MTMKAPGRAVPLDEENPMSQATRFILHALVAFALASAAPFAGANLGDSDDSASDDPNLQEALKAIEAQDWNRAIDLLIKAAAAHPDSADAHNFMGYAYRKAGDLEAAFKHYSEALKLNPDHKHAHEYIGEAYLMSDDLPKAEAHLAELQKLCTPI
ncbi:MAG: tetratricopeptide repeat protein, partial [Burkholderiales bacterium]